MAVTVDVDVVVTVDVVGLVDVVVVHPLHVNSHTSPAPSHKRFSKIVWHWSNDN